MADRTVRVRLEADISDFVSDIGVKAVAAVNRLERAASNADRRISTVGAKTEISDLGTKADVAGTKISKAGVAADAAGKKIAASAKTAAAELDKLDRSAQDVDRSVAGSSKTIEKASKVTDAHANALGRLRVAQLRLAEAQKSGKNGSALAGAEESVAAAERAVKKFEEAGEKSGRSFGSGLRKWLTGNGGAGDLGKTGGTVFGSGFLGVLKTPILGPAVVAILTAALLVSMPAVGAAASGAFVAAFGAGLAALPILFAAQSQQVGHIWSLTLSQLGADMQLLSAPFESVLINIAGYFQRTVDSFNPALAKVFADLAGPVDSFVDNFAAALEGLIPALGPISDAFTRVLADLGQGGAIKALIDDISSSMIELANSVAANPQAFGDLVRGLGDMIAAAVQLVVVLNDVNTGFEQLTGGLSLVEVAMGGLTALLGPLTLLFEGMNKQLDLINALTQSTDASGASMSSAAAKTVGLAQGLRQTGDGALHAKVGTDAAAAAFERAKERAEEARERFERFISTTFRLQQQMLTLSGAQISFQAAIDAASAAIKENGRTLDINTEKGRSNKLALDEVARSANQQTEQLLRSGKGTVAAAKAAEGSRASFVRLARQMGATKPEAEAMARALIGIPNVTREARLTANKKDLEKKLREAEAELKNPNLTKERKAKLNAEISKLKAAIAAAQAALNSLPGSKTVTITTRHVEERIVRQQTASGGGRAPVNANGGFYPHGMYPSYANGKLPEQATIAPGKGGGLVQWAEAETGGEAFIPLAPSKRARSEMILGKVAENFGYGLVKSFANGGINLANGQLVDIAYLLQQLGLPFDPTAGANYKATLTAANRANRAVIPARNTAIAADRAEQAAKAQVAVIQRQIALQQREIAAARAGKPKTKAGQAAEDRRVAAEQKELIKLQDQLYAAKTKVTKATKASNAADAVYKIRAEAAAKAAQANRDALEKLVQQQQAAVALAKQVSDSLQGQANIGDLFQQSLTGKGLLADLQAEGADLAAFGKLIAQLRARKLDEDLINQIIGKGADQGGELAQAILDGGLSLVNSLNKAQQNLENQANAIGAGVANAQYNTKIAGRRAGGGSVTEGKKYGINENGLEWFVAPVNGDIVPAGVKPRQYIRDMAGAGFGGGGRAVREVHHHYSNSFYGMSMDESDRIAQKVQALADFQAREY